MNKQEKTTKYTVSVGFQIHEPKIMEAKSYLKKEFNNKYDIDPHFNFVISALPEYSVKDLEKVMDDYFLKKSRIVLKLGNLDYEPKSRFFSIPIIGDEVMNIHKDLLNILNEIRDGYIRERDLIRIKEGHVTPKEEMYIHDYGYLRVLDNFTPHVTVGNINIDEPVDIKRVQTNLDKILSEFYNSEYIVEKIYVSFIEDAEIQTDYKLLWEKEYKLS